MGLGLAIAGVPGAAMLAFLTMIFSISQVLGPLVVVTWGAAAAWLYGVGEGGWALLWRASGAVLVSGSDNIDRPLLIQRGSAMPLGLIILGVFGGLIAFGFLGLFVSGRRCSRWRSGCSGPGRRTRIEPGAPAGGGGRAGRVMRSLPRSAAQG